MNKKTLLWIGCAVLVLAIGVIAVFTISNSRTTDPVPITQDIRKLYTDCANAVNTAPSLGLSISAVKQTAVGDEVMTQNVQQNMIYHGLGTDTLLASAEESIYIGTSTMSSSCIFTNDTLYTTLDGIRFSGQQSQEHYLANHPHGALLDISLYQQILYTKNKDTVTVYMSSPTAPEIWAVPEDAEFLESSGQATIDQDGALLQSSYSVRYRYGHCEVWLNVNAGYSTSQVGEITPPDETQYLSITSVQAPQLLEIACSYLMQAQNMQASSTDIIDCQAGGLYRTQTIDLSISGTGDELSAQLDTRITLTDHSRNDETAVSTQIITFENGECSVSADGQSPVPYGITAQQMRSDCQNILVSGILLPEHIAQAEIIPADDTLVLSFNANEVMAKLIFENSWQTLYQETIPIDALTEQYKMKNAQCTLTLDKYTWQPIASTLNCSGTYTIEGIQYQLDVAYAQTYQYTQ